MPKLKGRKTGQTYYQFLLTLFERNEFNPPEQKLNDDALVAAIHNEFPTKKVYLPLLRAAYNCGHMTGRVPPKLKSYRYLNGVRVDGWGHPLDEADVVGTLPEKGSK